MEHLKCFVDKIEYDMLENREALTKLQLQNVVHFNIRRKQLAEQLIAVLTQEKTNIGKLFEDVTHYLGLFAFVRRDDTPYLCAVTNEQVPNGRHVTLVELLDAHSASPKSKEIYVRSDFLKWLRLFYIYFHFGFYVMSLVNTTTPEHRDESFLKQLYEQFLFIEQNLQLLLRSPAHVAQLI